MKIANRNSCSYWSPWRCPGFQSPGLRDTPSERVIAAAGQCKQLIAVELAATRHLGLLVIDIHDRVIVCESWRKYDLISERWQGIGTPL